MLSSNGSIKQLAKTLICFGFDLMLILCFMTISCLPSKCVYVIKVY